MKEIIYITAIYTGTLIGAGFATGKEIQQFFTNPYGIIIAFLLFLTVNARLFTYININNIYTYEDLLEYKCPKIKPFIKALSLVFALLSYGVMCSGAGEALNFRGAGVVFSLLCCLIFVFELKGITYLNLIATPLIVIGILVIASAKVATFADTSFSSVKYVAYNTLCCLPVIPSLNHYIKDTKKAFVTAGVVSAFVCLLIFMVYFALPEVVCNLPLLETARSVNLTFFYYPALLLAMLTTAVSSGYGYMCCFKKGKYAHITMLFFSSLIMQSVDFGILVKYVFNLFGVLSIGILYFLLKKS